MPDRRFLESVTRLAFGRQRDTVDSGWFGSERSAGGIARADVVGPVALVEPMAIRRLGEHPDRAGSVLLVHETWGDTGPNLARLNVLADGSVVALRWIEPTLSEARVVRRLGPAGLAFVRQEIASVGLFDRSQARKMVTNPGCCGAGDAVTYRSDGRTVTVSRNLGPLGAYAPSPAWDRFDALVSDLAVPEPWIPGTSWSDPTWAPFHAARYCLGITRRSGSSDIPPLKATELTWSDGLRALGSFGEPAWADATNRFGTVSAETAYAVAASISERLVAMGFAPHRWSRRDPRPRSHSPTEEPQSPGIDGWPVHGLVHLEPIAVAGIAVSATTQVCAPETQATATAYRTALAAVTSWLATSADDVPLPSGVRIISPVKLILSGPTVLAFSQG